MPSPTRTVLSSIREHGVRYLLMGGQACILYGAAAQREMTAQALAGTETELAAVLEAEGRREWAADDTYWQPRIQELEAMRHSLRRERSAAMKEPPNGAST